MTDATFFGADITFSIIDDKVKIEWPAEWTNHAIINMPLTQQQAEAIKQGFITNCSCSLSIGTHTSNPAASIVNKPAHPMTDADRTAIELSKQARLLPGIQSIVQLPCGCDSLNHSLRQAIMHLNDNDEWSREQIADWLETLDVDLRFKIVEQQ